MTTGTSTAPGEAAAQMAGWTTGTLVLIGIGMVLAILMIVWGARLKARRKATERELREAAEAAEVAEVAEVAAAPPPVAAVPTEASAPGERDELTRMKGVGPKLAAQLNALGVTRYAEIAALSPAAAEALDARLEAFHGRLARDRWIDQARYLAAGDQAGFEAEFGRL